MIKTKVIGGDKLLKKFQKMGDVAEGEFKKVVDDTAIYAHSQAIGYINSNVSTGTGHLKQSMYVDTSLPDSAIVGNRAEYAGYVEFGTGKQVSVPTEFSNLASAIRSNPTDSFEMGLRKIKDWCKMRGIDIKAAYPIFMSILRNGVRPRPFFYPAYLDAKRYMKEESEKALKKLAKTK